MSLSATIGAARDCAKTLLFDSLCTHKFQGAVPHVMLVLDSQPCTLQKVLLEGYCDVMDAWNAQKTPSINWSKVKPWTSSPLPDDELNGVQPLRFPLSLSACTPCGGSDSIVKAPGDHTSTISYTVTPFVASELKEDMLRLQEFLRHCGMTESLNDKNKAENDCSPSITDVEKSVHSEIRKQSPPVAEVIQDTMPTSSCSAHSQEIGVAGDGMKRSDPHWKEDEFYKAYLGIAKYLQPLEFSLLEDSMENKMPAASSSTAHASSDLGLIKDDKRGRDFCAALRRGPRRELLVFILIQRSAFQNELHEYRLRLSLFDRGMRVIEHCHLDSMSAPADQLVLVAGKNVEKPLLTMCVANATVGEDQIFSYCRSCAFSPFTALPLAKAIAGTIDYHAWSRKEDPTLVRGMQGNAFSCSSTTPLFPVLPPSLLSAMTQHHEIWSLFPKDCFVYNGVPGSQWGSLRGMTEFDLERYMRAPVEGVGAPLKIVCRDPEKVLTFHGGLEDCLTNTGYYSAALEPARNDVHSHRERFTIPHGQKDKEDTDKKRVASCLTDGIHTRGEEAPPSLNFGRLRKKDYLAMLQKRGEKPQNKSNRKRSLTLHEDGSKYTVVREKKGNGAAGQAEMGVEEEEGVEGVAGSRINNSIGGTFPIGEVISESFDLSKLSGVCDVFGYPDPHKNISFVKPTPFQMTISDGKVVALSGNAPQDFVDLWTLVKQTEKGCCYVRELGIGLNPYVGVKHMLADVTSFERQWGIHLSLGLRHPLFVKQRHKMNADGTVAAAIEVQGPVIKRKGGKYHIDVFVDAAKLCCGPLVVDFSIPLLVS